MHENRWPISTTFNQQLHPRKKRKETEVNWSRVSQPFDGIFKELMSICVVRHADPET